jgi:prepilin-type N-terminal cleavage/methylation domain-containing protein
MNKQKGFSLIELLIVVAIILIIAAIAVPNLLRSRMAANESSAAGSERTIATSNVTYSITYGIGFAQDLSMLGPGGGGPATSDNADLIDSQLGLAGVHTKSGYNFTTYAALDQDTDGVFESYTSEGTPSNPNVTGVSFFCVDQTNVVRKDPGGSLAAFGAGESCDDPANPGTYPPM